MAMAAAKKETSVTKLYYHPMDNAKLLREDGSEIIFVRNYYMAVGEKDIEFLDKESDHPATGVEVADMETPQAKRYVESVEAKKKRDEAEVEANRTLLHREDHVPDFAMSTLEAREAANQVSGIGVSERLEWENQQKEDEKKKAEEKEKDEDTKREGTTGTTGIVNTGNLTRDQPAVSTSHTPTPHTTTHGQNRDKK